MAAFMSVSLTNDTRTSVILVVEDDIFMRFDVATCLQEAGYAVLEAAWSGENAIALCNSPAAFIGLVERSGKISSMGE